MDITDVSFEQLLWVLAVALFLIGTYNTVMSAIKTHMEIKKQQNAPLSQLTARVDAHDNMLANDKRRIEDMDERITSMRKESAMTLRGVRALLSHEINGNSVDKLQQSYDQIDDYLLKRE